MYLWPTSMCGDVKLKVEVLAHCIKALRIGVQLQRLAGILPSQITGIIAAPVSIDPCGNRLLQLYLCHHPMQPPASTSDFQLHIGRALRHSAFCITTKCLFPLQIVIVITLGTYRIDCCIIGRRLRNASVTVIFDFSFSRQQSLAPLN